MQQQCPRIVRSNREPHAHLAGNVERQHLGVPPDTLLILVAHHRLNHLLRHAVLHEVHRKAVPERLCSDRMYGKDDTVTPWGGHRLPYQAAHRVRAAHVPELFALFRLHGGQIFAQALHEGRIGQRYGAACSGDDRTACIPYLITGIPCPKQFLP